MVPTRCAGGIIALVLVLAGFAWVFDEPAGLTAAAVITLFLFYRFILSRRLLDMVAQSLEITRTTDKRIIRQGQTVRVSGKISCRVPDGMEIIVEDVIPPGAVLEQGDTVTRLSSPGLQETATRYSIVHNLLAVIFSLFLLSFVLCFSMLLSRLVWGGCFRFMHGFGAIVQGYGYSVSGLIQGIIIIVLLTCVCVCV